MRRISTLIITIILLASCARKEPVVSSGSFTIDGTTHSFSSLRIDHVGYENGDSSRFILRLTAYPGTFTCDTVRHSGYGTILRLFVVADACDLYPGATASAISADSLSQVLTIGQGGDTTATITLTSASVACQRADNNFLTYTFTLASDGSSGTGSYTGTHVVNRTVDQPAFGFIAFDTIAEALAAGYYYNWGELFGTGTTYCEFIFYSTDARFNDSGKLREGLQFSLGFMSDNSGIPSAGDYIVTDRPTPGTVLYGHKIVDASWGTYWTTYYNSASVGKANILAGSVASFQSTASTVAFTFDFTDQLNNNVVGTFSGPFVAR